MAQQSSIILIEFQRKFDSEQACYDHLYRMKWPEGFECPRCGHSKAYEITTLKSLYECAECVHQTTLTVGTIFEKTRTELLKWFWAIFLVAHDKRSVSATFLKRELQISYQTAWSMLHKIRQAMGKRDENYTLAGIVELDECFFGAPREGSRRGRGTEKAKALVELSLNDQGHPQFVKMRVIPDVKGPTLVKAVERDIDNGSTISSDHYRSYKALGKENYDHEPKEFNPDDNPDHLKWLHTIVSNVKAMIGSTFHGLDPKHLQTYLSEFCYRFNRRNFEGQWFNRLLKCSVLTQTVTYPELVG